MLRIKWDWGFTKNLRRKRRVGAILAAGLLVSLVSGCADVLAPGDDSLDGPTSTATVDTPSAAERVEAEAFEATLYPVVRQNCASCHGENGPGRTSFAHSDSFEAWSAIMDNNTVTLGNPAVSLLVRRLAVDGHGCWTDDCAADALVLQNEIARWDARIDSELGVSDFRVSTPSDLTVEATGMLTVVNLVAPAHAGGREPVTIRSDEPADGFPLGETEVTWTLTDGAGTTRAVRQRVMVVDTTPPVVTAPPAVIAAAAGAMTPVNLGMGMAQDLVDGSLVATHNAPATFPVGMTLVEWTATDASGNVGRAMQSVTVNALDEVALMIVAPVPVSVEATAALSLVDFGQATASGGEAPLMITNDAPADGFPVGGSAVTWTVRDAAGRTTMATQQVLVVDTTPPTITAPADITTMALSSLTPVTIGTADASDLADPAPSLSSNVPPQGFPEGETLVTWTATDASGNSASAVQRITIEPVVGDATAGALAYGTYCQSCHNADISLNLFNIQQGVSAANIENAIRSVSQMQSLSALIAQPQTRADIAAYILAQVEDEPGNTPEPVACESGRDQVQPTELLRLSKLQYSNTLRDLLTRQLGAATGSTIYASLGGELALIPEDESQSGYANRDQRISSTHIEGYLEVAFAFADSVTENNSRLVDFVGESCATNFSDRGCRERFLADFGSRALRHPLSDNEIDFYADASDYRELIASVLLSPGFLTLEQYRGTLDPTNADQVVLSGYELAAKLSYHFWQTMPDETLWQAAASGEILTDYDTVVDQVFTDPRTREGMASFFRGWLQLDDLLEFPESPTLRANFLTTDYGTGTALPANTDLAAYQQAAIDEVLALTDYITFEQSGALVDLFTSTGSFASDPTLAAAYGVSTWSGGSAPPVSFGAAQPRSGLLSRAALQMYGDFSSHPILKGARIRKHFLCDELEVPADTETPEEAVIHPEFSTRELTVAITEIPGTACAGCHAPLINPLGFPTESFDAIGRYRTEEVLFDDDGFERLRALVDTRSVPRVEPGATDAADDAIDLGRLVGESEKAEACFARHYYRFSQRREEVDATDQCEIDTLEFAVASGGIEEMLKTQALLPEFRVRVLPN